MNSFTIGGIVIILENSDTWSQTYRSKNNGTDHPMGDGSTVRQSLAGHAGKLRTTISGEAFDPSPLAALDTTQSLVLKCAKPRVIQSASNVIVLPSERRSDDAPTGWAIVDGVKVASTFSDVTDDTYTVTVNGSATAYQVEYVPEITVLANYNESFDTTSGRHKWSLECVEE